jgi:hypothetical protein
VLNGPVLYPLLPSCSVAVRCRAFWPGGLLVLPLQQDRTEERFTNQVDFLSHYRIITKISLQYKVPDYTFLEDTCVQVYLQSYPRELSANCSSKCFMLLSPGRLPQPLHCRWCLGQPKGKPAKQKCDGIVLEGMR